jgi:hypothetical protein
VPRRRFPRNVVRRLPAACTARTRPRPRDRPLVT